MLQGGQHRPTGNAVRFTVVTQTDPVTAAGRADQVSPTVVIGVGEFGFQFSDKRLRRLSRGDLLHGGYKTATLYLDLRAEALRRDRVAWGWGWHGDSPAGIVLATGLQVCRIMTTALRPAAHGLENSRFQADTRGSKALDFILSTDFTDLHRL